MRFLTKLLVLSLASLVITGICFSSVLTANAAVRGELIGNHVRVRLTPSLETTCNILFQVNRGEIVQVLDISGRFYRVNVRDYTNVYIYREFVETTEALVLSTTEDVVATEVAEPVDVADPHAAAHDAYLEALAFHSTAYSGLVYIADQQIPLSAFASGERMIDDLINYAKSYLGTPYRFGSMEPSRGLDCSGFVSLVMRNFGIYLYRSSASMAVGNGVQVDRNALRPGDLVFFATGGGGRVSHVGIYIGGDRFIHSATRGGVIISGMNETYYRNRFVRANRVL